MRKLIIAIVFAAGYSLLAYWQRGYYNPLSDLVVLFLVATIYFVIGKEVEEYGQVERGTEEAEQRRTGICQSAEQPRSVGIKPGDTVVHKVAISEGRIIRHERIAYTVKHVYPYFLVVEHPKGYTESLNFWRYLCGEVEIA